MRHRASHRLPHEDMLKDTLMAKKTRIARGIVFWCAWEVMVP